MSARCGSLFLVAPAEAGASARAGRRIRPGRAGRRPAAAPGRLTGCGEGRGGDPDGEEALLQAPWASFGPIRRVRSGVPRRRTGPRGNLSIAWPGFVMHPGVAEPGGGRVLILVDILDDRLEAIEADDDRERLRRYLELWREGAVDPLRDPGTVLVVELDDAPRPRRLVVNDGLTVAALGPSGSVGTCFGISDGP